MNQSFNGKCRAKNERKEKNLAFKDLIVFHTFVAKEIWFLCQIKEIRFLRHTPTLFVVIPCPTLFLKARKA